MRALFYCPNHTGHHFAYFSRQLPAFLELPVEIVIATTPMAIASIEYKKSLQRFERDVTFVTCCTPPPRGALKNARHRLRELRGAIDLIDPDHVAVGYVDGLWEVAYARAVAGARPWPRDRVVEAWLYRGDFGDPGDRSPRSRIKRRMFAGLLRRGLFRKLHIDHELLYEYAHRAAVGTPTEVVLTPNPVRLKPMLSKEEARRALGLPTGGPWFSLSGVIARYKGAYELLEAYGHLRQRSAERAGRLLLAGPHEEGVREVLAARPFRDWVSGGAIHSLDRYLDEDEMFTVAAASDLVLAPYPRHSGRSSIILWAAAAGRPSLGVREGCIGHVIREHQLGATCDALDPATLGDAIAAALRRPWTDADAQRVRKYVQFHRVENYRQVASALLRQRLQQ